MRREEWEEGLEVVNGKWYVGRQVGSDDLGESVEECLERLDVSCTHGSAQTISQSQALLTHSEDLDADPNTLPRLCDLLCGVLGQELLKGAEPSGAQPIQGLFDSLWVLVLDRLQHPDHLSEHIDRGRSRSR